MLRSSAESKAFPVGAWAPLERTARSTGTSAVSCASPALAPEPDCVDAERISFICALSSVTSVSSAARCCWSCSIVSAETVTVPADCAAVSACCACIIGMPVIAMPVAIIVNVTSRMRFSIALNISSPLGQRRNSVQCTS